MGITKVGVIPGCTVSFGCPLEVSRAHFQGAEDAKPRFFYPKRYLCRGPSKKWMCVRPPSVLVRPMSCSNLSNFAKKWRNLTKNWQQLKKFTKFWNTPKYVTIPLHATLRMELESLTNRIQPGGHIPGLDIGESTDVHKQQFQKNNYFFIFF